MNEKILLFVGHGKGQRGGYDPGACSNGFEEFKIAKEIARFANYELSRYNCDVELKNYDGELYLSERIAYENSSKCNLVVEIHLNAGGGTGTECYYSNGDIFGKAIAQNVCKSISDALAIRNRGAKTKLTIQGKDYFGIIRQTKATALLIETCFIDTADVYKVDTEEKQRIVGIAIAKALVESLKL